MKILYSYFRYTSRIFLKWAPFFARCNIMFHEKIKYEFHGKIRRNKDWVTKKKYIEEFAWGASLFRLHAIFSKYIFFVAFFVYSLSLCSQVTYLRKDPYKHIYNIVMGSILCDSIMSEWSKIHEYENLLQFNTSLLTSLRTRYNFRLCFSFSCSGYCLSLIKKTHALNYYSF